MSEFLGARISLISKSDIRYVGVLHQINSADSTVALENVKSYGTEGRPGTGVQVPPSEQVYEYIVFRGTDVKDLKIEEGPSAKENKPPPEVPNDPAIVGARPRPSGTGSVPPAPLPAQGAGLGPGAAPPGPPNQQGPPGPPPGPPGAPGAPGFGFFPPQMGWGRGGGPGPNGFGGMPYPPPQWFPQGQDFPHMGPGPWGNYPFPPGPGAPPGMQGQQQQPPFRPGPGNQGPGNIAQGLKPGPIGPTPDKKPVTPAQAAAAKSGSQSASQAPGQQAPQQHQKPFSVPPPPVESKPTVEEVRATAASLSATGPQAPGAQTIPTGPKGGAKPAQIMPAVPLPAALTNKARIPVSQAPAPVTPSALRDATEAAKAAVAVAMQKLEGPKPRADATGAGVDSLAAKVDAMLLNTSRPPAVSRGGAGRGGNRGRGEPPSALVTVPATDFDFAQANAAFEEREKLEKQNDNGVDGDAAKEAAGYDKKRSFFDNISSEAKDRLEQGTKPGGREWRGEEQRKNMETFGQSRIDSGRGYRGHHRGRGRGRGGRGRGQGRGWYGNNNDNNNVGAQPASQ